MDFKRLGVVIPTYDRPKQLRDALLSVAAQDLEFPFDVYVIEDGSTVAGEVMKDLKDELEELRPDCDFYHLPLPDNSGTPAHPRNVAMQMCENDLLAFCDDDDLWDPNHLTVLYAGLMKYNLDVAYAPYRVSSPYDTEEEAVANHCLVNGHVSPALAFDPRVLAISPNHNYVSSHILLRRGRVFELVGPEVWNESMARNEDWEFLIRAAKSGILIGKVSDKPTHTYVSTPKDEKQILEWKRKAAALEGKGYRGVVRWNGSQSVRW